MWCVSIVSGRLADKVIKRGMITITNARKLLTAIGKFENNLNFYSKVRSYNVLINKFSKLILL